MISPQINLSWGAGKQPARERMWVDPQAAMLLSFYSISLLNSSQENGKHSSYLLFSVFWIHLNGFFSPNLSLRISSPTWLEFSTSNDLGRFSTWAMFVLFHYCPWWRSRRCWQRKMGKCWSVLENTIWMWTYMGSKICCCTRVPLCSR